MWDFDYSSPGSIKFVLEANGLKMTKARGQNFLIDNNVRKKIVDLIIDGLREGENVWEVGPGIGSLTSLILKKGMTVKVFELDYGFIDILESAFKDENIQIVKGDALDTIKDEVKNIRISEFPKVIAGNLPYNVGTLLIAALLENQIFPDRMVFTFQKEVAQRIAAKETSSDWASLGILSSLTYESKVMFDISPSSFWPSPKVKSSVIVLNKKKNNTFDYSYYDAFVKVNRAVFMMKRKTIKNNLLHLFGDKTDEILKDVNIDPQIRPNMIKLEDIINLCKRVEL